VGDFFFTGCPPCRSTIPQMNEFAAYYGDEVAVVSMSFENQPTFDDAKAFRIRPCANTAMGGTTTARVPPGRPLTIAKLGKPLVAMLRTPIRGKRAIG